jgi:hypothetical protein
MPNVRFVSVVGAIVLSMVCGARLSAQGDSTLAARAADSVARDIRSMTLPPIRRPIGAVYTFGSPADSLEWAHARDLAVSSTDFRIVVSLQDRLLWVVSGTSDTLLSAPVAVASGLKLDYAGRSWTFRTPRGRHQVLGKAVDREWSPPDWLYAETAVEYGLKLRPLPATGVRLKDGSFLTVQSGVVGLIPAGSQKFDPLPTDEHIVFDGTLFIPPMSTRNRKVSGELGPFALDLGDGYLLHGTPDQGSIGNAVTHGCIRLSDEDIGWLYDHIDVGTPVFIY